MTIIAHRPYSRRPPPGQYDNGFFTNELANIQSALLPVGTRLVRSSTMVDVTDDVILCDCTAGPISVTLLDPSRVQWDIVTIKKIDASANQVTIVGTVDGLVNPTSHAIWNVVTIMSDGTAWFVRSVGADIGTSLGSTVTRTSNVTNNSATPASAGLVVAVTAGQSYRIHYVLFLSNNFAGSGLAILSVAYPATTTILAGVLGLTNTSTVSLQSFVGAGSPMSLGSTWLNFSTVTPIAFAIDLILRNVTSSGNVDLQFATAGAGNTVTVGDGSCVLPAVL